MITTDRPSYAKARLFLVSSLALTMAGIGASLRANTATDLQRVFFDPIDKAHSAEMIANILGLPFLGFAATIAVGSPSAWDCSCQWPAYVSRSVRSS